jgi:diguanylate cyclase (GGDEF)-like protein
MDGYTGVFAGGALLVAIFAMGVAFRAHTRALAGSRREALTDTLTGLGNRRKLLEDLEDALSDRGTSRLLVVLDLDGFKAYNDVFGHPAGDALLARLGRRIEAGLPPRAQAYRLGGDEFCALVDDRGGDYDAIVAAVSRSLSESGDGVTASHGMIAIPREADSPERALQLADRRLYADKSGRPNDLEVRDALSEALGSRRGAPEGFDPVTELAGRVARQLGLWGEQLELVVRAAELHEVGKAAIPDAILRPPHPLDDAERALLRQHTVVGERMLSSAEALSPVATLVRACDERFDGDGYPDGLAGERIPLGARIVAVCEAFEALTSAPPAGEGEPRRSALARMRQEAGGRFDPEVLEALAVATEPGRAAPGSSRRARSGIVATLALSAALLLPGSALAGTVSLYNGKLRVTASPGQANKLTVEAGTDHRGTGALVKEEGAGATLTAGSGCSRYAAGRVYCSLPQSITVEAGDGNDTVVSYSRLPVTLRGGSGDDALYGSAGQDSVDGQDGDDTLGGGFGGDSLQGGPGNDTANYSYYSSPIVVDLDDVADDGAANERANVAGDIENILGGSGADTLIGDDDANTIEGGAGKDVLRSGGGDDTLRARDGERDDVACGSGHDAGTADASDAIAGDCDSLLIHPPMLARAAPVRLQSRPVRLTRRGIAAIRLRCNAALGERCTGTVTLDVASSKAKKVKSSRSGRRRIIGRARFSAGRGRLAVVKVRISRNGRRRVLRRRKLRCRVSVAVRRRDGSVATVRSKLTLMAPKPAPR